MAGYSKLDCGMLHSSVWQEPHDVRVAWITMLLLTDYHGRVYAAIPALAMHNAVSVARMEEIIQIFMSPDPYSKSKDYDGRRIAEIDGGWQVINYPKYRDGLRSPDRTANQRKQRQRDRERGEDVANVTVCHADVTPMSRYVTASHAYSDSDSDSDSDSESIQDSTTYYSAEPEADSTRQPVEVPVMVFPCKGLKLKSYGLRQSKLDEWLETYGDSLNVPHELRSARQWLLDNPKRQKTHTGMTKFLGAWLDRAQNRRGGKQEKMTLTGMAVGEYGENE